MSSQPNVSAKVAVAVDKKPWYKRAWDWIDEKTANVVTWAKTITVKKVQQICASLIPILATFATVAAVIPVIGSILSSVLIALEVTCVLIVVTGESLSVAVPIMAAVGKFLYQGIVYRKWDHRLLRDAVSAISNAEGKRAATGQTVKRQLWILLACLALAAFFWTTETLTSGTVFIVTLIGLATAGASYKLYPPATLVSLALIHVLPPLFWIKDSCDDNSIICGFRPLGVMLAFLLYSLTLSPHSILTLFSVLKQDPPQDAQISLYRRLIRTCVTIFVAIIGAATFWSAGTQAALLLFFWQLSSLLNSIDYIIANQWQVNLVTTVLRIDASSPMKLLVTGLAKFLNSDPKFGVPTWILYLIAFLRGAIASFIMLKLFLMCSHFFLLSYILVVLAWVLATSQDVAFLKSALRGQIETDALWRLRFCFNIL